MSKAIVTSHNLLSKDFVFFCDMTGSIISIFRSLIGHLGVVELDCTQHSIVLDITKAEFELHAELHGGSVYGGSMAW